VRPVVCGGLGVYLCFSKTEGNPQELIRATHDIDLMLTQRQILDQSQRLAIAEIITEKLDYIVVSDAKHFQFAKSDGQPLDILAPPIAGIETDGFRVKLVKSRLHGHLTEEALFIEEGLRSIPLSKFLPSTEPGSDLEVDVPSPTNQLIMKLFAFNDRNEGDRRDMERAQAQAWDIYIVVMLADRNDYKEGRAFLDKHHDSEIVKTARSIVGNSFQAIGQEGWQRVLEASAFYPNLSRTERESMLEKAARRLAQWFE